MTAPTRIQLRRTAGWRKPDGTVVVAHPSRWGNPFRFRDRSTGLVRVPGVLTGGAWEFEGRISADGSRHDMYFPDGTWHVANVRYATRGELVELYRRALTRETDAALTMALAHHLVQVTVDDVQAELAGRDLACWCPLVDARGQRVACHADVLLEIANGDNP